MDRTPASGGPAEVVIHYRLRPGVQREFLAAQAALSAGLAGSAQYLGGSEHMAQTPAVGNDHQQTDWTIVRHFASAQAAREWVDAAHMPAGELEPLLAQPPTLNVLLEPGPRTAGTAVITSRVRPGSEEWFLVRQGQMQAAQAQFPGYLGQHDQAPIPGLNPDWVTVIGYDTAEHLQAWLDSPARAQFLANAVGHVESYDCRPAASAFESWFTAVRPSDAPPPAAWKLNAIVLLVLYPVVMAEIIWLNPLLTGLGVPLSTFIGNVISVAATGFVLIPVASRVLGWWLVPEASQARATNWRGVAALAGCYALSVLFFQALTKSLGW